MSSLRNSIVMRSLGHLTAVASVVVAALAVNLILGEARWGFAGQPVAHSNHLWSFVGTVAGGLAFTLAGACPTRQLFLSGEGNADATAFVLGMLAAAGLAPSLGMETRPDIVVLDTVIVGGPNSRSMIVVAASLAICLMMGLIIRREES
jgi:YedE family putative selenium metabolism protein